MKLHLIKITNLRSKLWQWRYAGYGGSCISKRDAINDASIMAGLKWERATDDMQTASLGRGLTLCCTRGLNEHDRIDWELLILRERDGAAMCRTNTFDSEDEAKCSAPAFAQRWKNEINEASRSQMTK